MSNYGHPEVGQTLNTSIWDDLYSGYEPGKPVGIQYPTEALVVFVSNLRKSRGLCEYFDDEGTEWTTRNSFQGKALEIGFGSTANLKMLKEKGFDTCGIEVSREAVMRGMGGGLDLREWNPSEKMPVEDNTFDLVAGLQCIYYNLDFEAFERDLYRIMKSGARFIFSFFSPKHSYMNFVQMVSPGLGEFRADHPNKRLVGATFICPPDKDYLKRLFPSFHGVRVFTTESDQTPMFESWWYVTGEK